MPDLEQDRPEMFTVNGNAFQGVLSIAANHNEQDRALVVMLKGHIASLSAYEALDLLQWLYEQRDALTSLAHREQSQDALDEL